MHPFDSFPYHFYFILFILNCSISYHFISFHFTLHVIPCLTSRLLTQKFFDLSKVPVRCPTRSEKLPVSNFWPTRHSVTQEYTCWLPEGFQKLFEKVKNGNTEMFFNEAVQPHLRDSLEEGNFELQTRDSLIKTSFWWRFWSAIRDQLICRENQKFFCSKSPRTSTKIFGKSLDSK